MMETFSLTRLIHHAVNKLPLADPEQAAHDLAKEEARALGETLNGVGIPSSFLFRDNLAVAGVVEKTTSSVFDFLWPNMKVMQFGSTVLTGLGPNYDIVSGGTRPSAAWGTEIADPGKTTPTFASYTMTPKKVSSWANVSKLLRIQGNVNPSMDRHILNQLGAAIAEKVDEAALAGAGAPAPTGIINWSGVPTVSSSGALDDSHVLELEQAISDLNAGKRQLHYLTTPALRNTLKAAGSWDRTPAYLIFEGIPSEDGICNAYHSGVSTSVPAGHVIFGDFSQLVIGQFGPIDLQINPYTEDTTGKIKVTATSFWDVAVAQPNSFAIITDA